MLFYRRALFAIACAFAFAGSAEALTVLNPGGDTKSLTPSTIYANSTVVAPGNFSHTYSFSPNLLTGAATVTIQPVNPTLGVANLTFAFFQGASLLGVPLSVTDGAGVWVNPVGSLTLALLSSVSDYSLKISGTGLAPFGIYSFSATTTPLPPALLLFGSALGALSLLGRRSRRRQTV